MWWSRSLFSCVPGGAQRRGTVVGDRAGHLWHIRRGDPELHRRGPLGLALHGDRSPLWFVWSVVPALYAWQPVVFLDTRMALLALVPGFLVSWSVDRRATAAGLLPAWYMRLRHMLTLGATLALAAGSLAPSPYFHG